MICTVHCADMSNYGSLHVQRLLLSSILDFRRFILQAMSASASKLTEEEVVENIESGASSTESSNEGSNDERKSVVQPLELGFDEIDNATTQQLIDAVSTLSTKLPEIKKDIKEMKENLNNKTIMKAVIMGYIADMIG